MGPPQRPADRPAEKQGREQTTDMNSLTDVMFGTGVDLRAEEAAMQASYRDSQSQSFGSYNSQSTTTLTPSNSFGASQSFSFPSSGLASQQPWPQQAIEDELANKHKAAARAYNERKQSPLYDPFLQMNMLRKKIQAKAYENGVKTDLTGVYYKTDNRAPSSTVGMDPNGYGVITASEATSSWIQADAQLTDLLAILSLAANERLRGITEDAYALARTRQTTSHGIVHPDFAAIATGDGKVDNTTAVPVSISDSNWDKQPESATSPSSIIPSKRPLEESAQNQNRLPTPPTEPSPTPKATMSYSNTLTTALRTLQTADLDAEKARLAARQKRQNAAKAAANASPADGAINGTDASSATPGTAMPANAVAPESVKLSKKAKEKADKEKAEAESQKFANAAANAALGGGRKFSWMKSGGAAKPAPPSRMTTGFGAAAAGFPAGAGGPAAVGRAAETQEGLQAKNRKMGNWREDGKQGKGIQIHDLSIALESDGKSRKALARVWAKLRTRDEVEA